MMTLLAKQQAFSFLQAQFTFELYSRGYKITEGEWWRSPETAAIYAKQGKGVANSLHCIRLARDLNLFKDGVYLISVDDYREAGGIWKAYSTDDYQCTWGGDFSTADAVHFSIEHNGIR